MDEMEWADLFDMAPAPTPPALAPLPRPAFRPVAAAPPLPASQSPVAGVELEPWTVDDDLGGILGPVSTPAPNQTTNLWELTDDETKETKQAKKQETTKPVVSYPAEPGNQRRDSQTIDVGPPRDASGISFDANTGNYEDFGDGEEDETPPFFQGLLIGSAGTGKTTLLKERIKENPKYGLLAATTGIAAVNLSSEDCTVRTMHSVLGFYDLNSLKQNYQRGRLTSKLMEVSSKGVNRLIVDEMSMLPDTMFEIILQALKEVNNYQTVIDRGGLGLMLVGDFLQLPPVEGKYVFESDKFAPFEREGNIEKLTKIWRQVDTDFLEALQCARQGDGAKMVDILYHHPDIKFANQLDDEFEGTTIVGTNQEVDRINFIRLQGLRQAGKKTLAVKSTRWGKEDSSWKNIPPEVELSIDGYVMILTNGGEGAYANGSCGWVREFTAGGKVWIELHEPKTAAKSAEIGLITRKCFDKHSVEKYGPLPEDKATWTEFKSDAGLKMKYGPGKVGYVAYCAALTKQYRVEGNKPYYDFDEEMMVVGEIQYLPVRLAYATTVHKSQGLSLDRCQIDYIGSGRGKNFFGSAGMSYVALSRVRTPQGLRIVGTPGDVDKKTNVLRKVLRWA